MSKISLESTIAIRLVEFSNFNSIKEQAEYCLFLIMTSRLLKSPTYGELATDQLNEMIKNIFRNLNTNNNSDDTACFLIVIKLISKYQNYKLDIIELHHFFKENALPSCSVSIKIAYLSCFMHKNNKKILESIYSTQVLKNSISSTSILNIYILIAVLAFDKLYFRKKLIKIITSEINLLMTSKDAKMVKSSKSMMSLLTVTNKNFNKNTISSLKHELNEDYLLVKTGDIFAGIEEVFFSNPLNSDIHFFNAQKLISLL